MKKKKKLSWEAILLIFIVIILLKNHNKQGNVSMTYNYYDANGNLITMDRQSIVNGTTGVAFIAVNTTVRNTGDVPLTSVGISGSYPPVLRVAYLSIPSVPSLAPGASASFVSNLINVTQFEGQVVDLSVTLTGNYITGEGVTSDITYTGTARINVQPEALPITGTIYYVSMTGSDSNNGLTTSTPLKTITKVNSLSLAPGDGILFKRGDTWRFVNDGFLTLKTGIYYGAYGSGNKPIFLSSINASDPNAWKNIGGNIWEFPSGNEVLFPTELLSNPSFDTDTTGWSFYAETGASASGARTTTDYDTSPAGYMATITTAGTSGSNIQLYTNGINIQAGKIYKLSFRAKATQPFTLFDINLMGASSPWPGYTSSRTGVTPSITSSWNTYNAYFTTSTTSTNARLTIYLGKNPPANTVFYLDTLSFKEVTSGYSNVNYEVGNLIFNNEASLGYYKWNISTVTAQDYFTYDNVNKKVKMYSTTNPALRYSSIEMATGQSTYTGGGGSIPISSGAHDIVFENIHVKYACRLAIAASNGVYNVIVRDSIFDYTGGCYMYYNGNPVRYGNAIQFWMNSDHILVTRNLIRNTWDAAISPQSSTDSGAVTIKNFEASYNIITGASYPFEYFSSATGSITHNMTVHHNTFIDSGRGWAGTIQPGRNNGFLRMSRTPVDTQDIILRDNLYVGSSWKLIDVGSGSPNNWQSELIMDYNLYSGVSGNFMTWKNAVSYSDLATFTSASGQEVHGRREVNSVVLDSNYKPSGAACTMSSTGSYVGAVPC